MKSLVIAAAMLLAACGQSGQTNGSQDSVRKESAPAGSPSEQAGTVQKEDGKVIRLAVSTTKEGGYLLGRTDAPVKLVEYGARTCPACAKFTVDATDAIEDYVAAGKVSYEFRDFAVHGLPDIAATLVGQCGAPETFFPILNDTYAAQAKSLGILQNTEKAVLKSYEKRPVTDFLAFLAERGGYVAIARQHGVTQKEADACLKDAKKAQRLVDQTNEAAKSIEGTPSFLVNGKTVDGASWQAVETALKKAGA